MNIKYTIVAALALCVAPAFANPNLTGGVGPEIFLVFFFLAAPVAIILLVAAFSNHGKAIGVVCISLVAIYTGLLGVRYIELLSDWESGAFVLASLILFGLFTIALINYFFTSKRLRAVGVVATIIACTGLGFMTPAIVNYRYYTTIDNDFLENSNDTITLQGAYHVQLGDGRLLRVDRKEVQYLRQIDHAEHEMRYLRELSPKERIDNSEEPIAASVMPLDAGRFGIAVQAPTPVRERRRKNRDLAALFHIPLTEIINDAYYRRDLGEAHWVGQQREKNLKLYFAAANNELVDDVSALLAAGANPNMEFEYSEQVWTPLRMTAFKGNADVMRVLIAAGADTNVVFENQNTLLQIAVTHGFSSGFVDTVKVLIETGADVNAVDDKQNTPLHVVSGRSGTLAGGFNPMVAAAELLVDAGANVSARNAKGYTPLHTAATDNVAHIEFLISAGADVRIENDAGQTPLELARGYCCDRIKKQKMIAAFEAAQTER